MPSADEYRRAAEIARRLTVSDEDRRAMLTVLDEERARLIAERASIDEQLNNLEAIISGHRAALAH